jgi:hypothetical protein
MPKFKTLTTGQTEKIHSGQMAAYRAVQGNAAVDPDGLTDVWEWDANGARWELFEHVPHADIRTSTLSGPTGMDRR